MAIAAEDKVVIDEVVAKLEALKQEILLSIPMRSTGASNLFNELGPVIDKLNKLEVV